MIRQNVIGGYMYLRSLIGPMDLMYAWYDGAWRRIATADYGSGDPDNAWTYAAAPAHARGARHARVTHWRKMIHSLPPTASTRCCRATR